MRRSRSRLATIKTGARGIRRHRKVNRQSSREILAELKHRLAEIYDLDAAESVLSWDEATYMPKGGAVARGRQAALLKRKHTKAAGEEDDQGERTRLLRGRDFNCAVFSDYADLRRVDFTEASLRSVSFDSSKLQGASLNRAQLQGADLTRAQLQGASLFRAQLQGASLTVAQLQGANLSEAQLQGAFLNSAELQGAVLIWAQLQGASLTMAQLQGADLNGAQLQGANLSEAQLQGANLDVPH